MKHKLLRWISPAISVCLFVLALVLIHHELKGYRLQDVVQQLRRAGNEALLGAAALVIFKYFVLTASDTLALKYIRHPVPYRNLALASFVGSAFNNAATFVGGGAARYRIYSALGLSAREIGVMILFCGWTFWLGFFLIAGAVFVLEPQIAVPAGIRISDFGFRILGGVCLALVGLYFLTIYLWRRGKGDILHLPPAFLRKRSSPPVPKSRMSPFLLPLRVPSVALSAGQIAITSIDWLLAATVLYVLLPYEMHMPFLGFLGVFMLGQGAGMITHIPGGLGVFETVLLYSLADGDGAVAGTGDTSFAPTLMAALLLYRLLYYLLPLLVGSLLLALHEILPQGLPGRSTGDASFAPTLPLETPD